MSDLRTIYDRFVAQPNVDDLHTDATLSYISSGTNVTGVNDIVKFLLGARNEIQTTEKVLAYHTGNSSLTVEIAFECKFKNGPSWIAPGVEGNMIDGVVIKLPLIKNVVFTDGKIRSIRVYWDQATVLKQLEIVGARGRGWPITDGSNQIDLITKTVVPEEKPKIQKTIAEVKPTIPKIDIVKAKRESIQTPSRRTYSISNDLEDEPKETPRLPRSGWQNNRQDFLLSEEGDVSLKDRSPVRLPRVGQAPRREYSFSNLHEAYQNDTPIKPRQQPTHFEFDDGSDETMTKKPSVGGGTGGQRIDLFDGSNEETPKPVKSEKLNPRGLQHETIFHDNEGPMSSNLKPSIGGGTGGRRPEETIFIQAEEEEIPIQPKKQTIPRRDQSHFSFEDEAPSTPIQPRSLHHSLQHFSIEGTPDPHEAEYRARALQRKEVNHFRPDTIPHFEFDEQNAPPAKKENSDGMNKLIKGNARSWMMGTDSPIKQPDRRSGLPKKGLTAHFSFGEVSPGSVEEEKENGGHTTSQTKRLHVPSKSEEMHWWESPEENGTRTIDTHTKRMHVPAKTEEKNWWDTPDKLGDERPASSHTTKRMHVPVKSEEKEWWE